MHLFCCAHPSHSSESNKANLVPSTHPCQKHWCKLAIVIGVLIVIGSSALGIMGLLQHYGVSLPKNLAPVIGTIGHSSNFWVIGLTGISIGLFFIGKGVQSLKKENHEIAILQESVSQNLPQNDSQQTNSQLKYTPLLNTLRIKLNDRRFIDIKDSKWFMNNRIDSSLFEMDLGNDLINYNFWMLLNRKKGQKYQAEEDGKLVEYRGDKNLLDEEKVCAVVDCTLKALEKFLSDQKEITETHRFVIRSIFSSNNRFIRMNREVFNRASIKEGSTIEQILKPEFREKRLSLIQALRDVSSNKNKKQAQRRVEDCFMDLVLYEFAFASELGIDLELISDGGSGGARYARDRYGQKILVIKPDDEGPLGTNNPQWYAPIKRLLISPKSCLDGNSESLAELDSWLCDRHFGFWSVPSTTIRYINSRGFVGHHNKKCSVQMFVDECQTLSEYIGISSKYCNLPRRFLRRHFEKNKEELLEKLPIQLLQKIALHNFLIEDIDCHFENILVCLWDPKKTGRIDSIFQGNSLQKPIKDSIQQPIQQPTQDPIQDFVSNLFKEKNNQQLILKLLSFSEIDLQSEKKNITLIKHDGGSSNPHQHPYDCDYLQIRFKHLFEVLPHFDQPCLLESAQLMEGKKENLKKFLIEKATRDLCNVVISGIFQEFIRENKENFEKYIFENTANDELRHQLINNLVVATGVTGAKRINYRYHFNYHLKRIKKNIKTRIESFQVMHNFLEQSSTSPMRELLQVKSRADFQREMTDLEDIVFECNT